MELRAQPPRSPHALVGHSVRKPHKLGCGSLTSLPSLWRQRGEEGKRRNRRLIGTGPLCEPQPRHLPGSSGAGRSAKAPAVLSVPAQSWGQGGLGSIHWPSLPEELHLTGDLRVLGTAPLS